MPKCLKFCKNMVKMPKGYKRIKIKKPCERDEVIRKGQY